jgi:hypothetical protein
MSLFFLSSGDRSHPRPAPVQQAPLPPLDTTGNPHTTLPANQLPIPQPFTGPLWLENAWSMTIPGLPLLPGATSSVNPTRCLTWFLGASLWAPFIDAILTHAALCGYNTITISWPDCQDYCGMSPTAFVSLCAYVKSWGFRVHVKWWAKTSNTVWTAPQNSDWPTIQAWVGPVLSALMSAGALDAVSPWEWDANNIAGPQGTAILDGISQLVTPAKVEPWYHGSPGNVWWDAPTSNRDIFWQQRTAAGMTGILYQAQPPNVWDMGTRQARFLDSTNHAAFVATGARFVAWETDGVEQFDGAQPDEATSAMHGYLDLCTPGLMPVTGVGDGGWLPDGTTLTAP